MKSLTLLFATLAPLAVAEELCSQYAHYSSEGHEFNNNVWGKDAGSGSQCTYVDTAALDGSSWHSTWSWSGSDDDVKAYPYSGLELGEKLLLDDIKSMPSTTTWGYEGTDIRANVAYDLFTASDPNHDTGSGEFELMIWLGKLGDIYPIGDSVGTVNVNNNDWDLFVGMNGDMKVFSFITPDDRNTFAADVKVFFEYLIDNQGFPASEQYLLTFQFGSESFTGEEAKFTVSGWAGDVFGW